jgi:hypothetical protein
MVLSTTLLTSSCPAALLEEQPAGLFPSASTNTFYLFPLFHIKSRNPKSARIGEAHVDKQPLKMINGNMKIIYNKHPLYLFAVILNGNHDANLFKT